MRRTYMEKEGGVAVLSSSSLNFVDQLLKAILTASMYEKQEKKKIKTKAKCSTRATPFFFLKKKKENLMYFFLFFFFFPVT